MARQYQRDTLARYLRMVRTSAEAGYIRGALASWNMARGYSIGVGAHIRPSTYAWVGMRVEGK